MINMHLEYLFGRNMNAPERRAQITAEIVAHTGIDEAMIARLVRAFYAKVQQDPLLGPVFDQRIVDWELHLQRMCTFWSSVALMSGRYHGQPMEKHEPLAVDGRHFDRWLALFEATAHDVCPPVAAAHFIARTPDCRKPGARHRWPERHSADEGTALEAPGCAGSSPQ